MERLGVVLFNLGGPDSPEAVEPFLFNLFNDPAIIGLPGVLRWPLAKFISRRRAPVATEIYRHLGGKSPLLEETEAQAEALGHALAEYLGEGADEVRVFIAMRYWHPMTAATVSAVKAFNPDNIVLLPLYPQFSTTSTGSSIKEWRRVAAAQGLAAPTRTVCCYPVEQGYIESLAGLVRPAIEAAQKHGRFRVLFSAHGLPEKIIAKGDPYSWQIEATAGALVKALSVAGLDHAVCFQSRVGRLKWIGPSLDDEIERAAMDGVAVVVVPIAFVSEHSETLVELDIEYRDMAEKLGVPAYIRVPAIGVETTFISALARIAAFALKDGALKGDTQTCSAAGGRQCPAVHGQCPL